MKTTDGKHFSYVYGPVPSRRLGSSLGLDIVPFKTCTYNCIYCQLGRTPETTVSRKAYIPGHEITDELREWLRNGKYKLDYVTVSGAGEPTLNSDIGGIISDIKMITDIPVAVITNSSLLYRKEVRDELKEADLVIPSLDAGSEILFRYMNRPSPEITFGEMVEGLQVFSKEFKGDIWMEVFLAYPGNTLEHDLYSLNDCLNRIRCSRIHLNTPTRPTAENYAEVPSNEKLLLAKRILGRKAEVIFPVKKSTAKAGGKGLDAGMILNLLKRRPCTLTDLAESFQTSPNEVLKYLTVLLEEKCIDAVEDGNSRYYRWL